MGTSSLTRALGRILLAASLLLVALPACSGDDGSGTSTDQDATGSDVLVPNAAPAVTITRPSQGDVFPSGEAITFSATVTDDYDDPEQLAIAWTSDRETNPLSELPANSLGGTTFELDTLAPGEHLITLTAEDSGGKVGVASVLITINEAPGAPEVAITPAAPAVDDDLTAEILTPAVDPNRASTALTYSYRWFKGGEFASVTTPTLSHTLTASGETWEVRVRANDGLADGPEGTASVTIGNGAPSCDVASIFPSAGDTTTTFTCSCSGWSDPDGDEADDRCQFFDGVTPLAPEGSCELDPSATAKGMDLNCEYIPSDGASDGEARASTSVPVLNAPPTAPTATLSPTVDVTALSELTCALGDPSTDPDGDNLTYAAAWVVNGYEGTAASSTVVAGSLETSSGAAPRKGDTVKCRLRASDGSATSAPGESDEVTLVNAPPEVGQVLIMPVGGARIDESAVLACENQGATDADGDSVTLTYAWYVNGELVDGEDSKHLDGDSFDRDDSVACAITATDGEDDSDPADSKSPVTIGNALPSLVSATLEPAQTSPYGLFTCVPQGWVDPDGDALEVGYAWYVVDGDTETLLPAETGGTYSPSALSPGDTVRCVVTPRNGVETGAPVSSGLGAVVAPEPTAPVVTVAAPDGASGVIRCDFVQVAQHFAGAVSYDYFWTINGAAEISGVATMSGLSDCDLVTCRAVASDGATTLSSETAELLLPVGPSCDTGDDCQTPICNPTGGCGFVAANDSPCDDGDACTVGDHCDNGFCVATTYADAGTPCEDGQFCTDGDACDDAGQCVAGDDPCATEAGSCIVGVCNELLEECVYSTRDDGTACDDGDGCTSGDQCDSGACIPGVTEDCSASGDACNAGVCESLSASDFHCVTEPRPSGVACTSTDFCVVDATCDGQGACTGGDPRDCQAEVGDSCNTAICDSTLAQCLSFPVADGAPCDDEDACTLEDICKNGTCIGDDDTCVDDRMSDLKTANAPPAVVSLGTGRYAALWWEHTAGTATHVYRMRHSSAYRAREEQELNATQDYQDRVVAGYQTRLAANAAGDHMAVTMDATSGASHVTFFMRLQVLDYLGEEVGATESAFTLRQEPNLSSFNDWEVRALPVANAAGDFGVVVRATWPAVSGATMTPASVGAIALYPPTGVATVGTPTVLVPEDQLDPARVNYDARAIPGGNGDLLVAWAGTDGQTISLRRFSAIGIPKTQSPIAVAAAPGPVYAVRVAPRADGGAFVAWDATNIDGSGRGIQAALVAADGTVGNPVQVNAGFFDDQILGDIDAFGDGGAVVAYDDEHGDAQGWAVFAQLLTSDGALDGDAIPVNSQQAGDQRYASLAVLSTQEFVVPFVGAGGVVWTRRYLRSGEPSIAWPERRVNATTAGNQDSPAVASLPDGTVGVAYRSPVAGRTDTDIVARVLDRHGVPQLPEIVVNTQNANNQHTPQIGAGVSELVVIWVTGDEVHGQRIDPVAGLVGSEMSLRTENTPPALAVSPVDGSFLVAQRTEFNPNWYIAGQVFEPDGTPRASAFNDGNPLPATPTAVADPKGGFVILFDSTSTNKSPKARRVKADGTLGGVVDVGGLDGTSILAADFTPDGAELIVCVHANYHVDCVRRDGDSLAALGVGIRLTDDYASVPEVAVPSVAMVDGSRLVATWDSHLVDHAEQGIAYGQFALTGAQLRPRLGANLFGDGRQFDSAITLPSATTALMVYTSEDKDGDGFGVYLRVLPTY